MAIGSMTTNSTVDMIDKTLKTENAPADAAAVGNIILDFTKETPQPIFYSKAEVDKLLEACKEAAKRAALLAANPVGKLWASDDPTSPASIVGGTWEQIKDRFILAAGDTYAAGSTGGEPTHTHDYALAYNAFYGAIIGLDEDLIRSFDYATSTYKASHGITYTSKIKKNSGFVGSYEDIAGVSFMRNDAKTNTASTMPPYTAMYVWKRIA
jgi:hypothetical protein|nr:MAG TPA_asm: baseplate protein [Caudoviricetes sp.]